MSDTDLDLNLMLLRTARTLAELYRKSGNAESEEAAHRLASAVKARIVAEMRR